MAVDRFPEGAEGSRRAMRPVQYRNNVVNRIDHSEISHQFSWNLFASECKMTGILDICYCKKNQEYQERRRKIRSSLTRMRIKDPNPFSDLWDWYGKWSSGDLPSYQSRRQYISELYKPLLDFLETDRAERASEPINEPTGWARVDRGVDKIIYQLETSENEEDYQAVGLFCRETLISLAQNVYDPEKHAGQDGIEPSKTDAKKMLENYLAVELSGGSNESARRHAKASLSLANDLQHRRTATSKDAALCAEATRTVVNIVAIISEYR